MDIEYWYIHKSVEDKEITCDFSNVKEVENMWYSWELNPQLLGSREEFTSVFLSKFWKLQKHPVIPQKAQHFLSRGIRGYLTLLMKILIHVNCFTSVAHFYPNSFYFTAYLAFSLAVEHNAC